MSSWFKKPLNIGITVGAVILATVAAFLVIWGVTHHTEGEMLQVCWAEDGSAQYVGGIELRTTNPAEGSLDEPCTRPEELVWPEKQIPITLSAETADGQAVGEIAYEGHLLESAVVGLNRQVGFELYRMGGGVHTTSAAVRFGGAFEGAGELSAPPGYVTHRRVDNALRGHIWIRSDVVSDTRLLHLVLEHELLHLAGLRHDDFTLSIMFPMIREEWRTGVMSTAHVTDLDRSNLRRLYMR